jgi:hypothetical protein
MDSASVARFYVHPDESHKYYAMAISYTDQKLVIFNRPSVIPSYDR